MLPPGGGPARVLGTGGWRRSVSPFLWQAKVCKGGGPQCEKVEEGRGGSVMDGSSDWGHSRRHTHLLSSTAGPSLAPISVVGPHCTSSSCTSWSLHPSAGGRRGCISASSVDRKQFIAGAHHWRVPCLWGSRAIAGGRTGSITSLRSQRAPNGNTCAVHCIQLRSSTTLPLHPPWRPRFEQVGMPEWVEVPADDAQGLLCRLIRPVAARGARAWRLCVHAYARVCMHATGRVAYSVRTPL